MNIVYRLRWLGPVILLLSLLVPGSAAGQEFHSLWSIGGDREDRLRVSQLRGDTTAAGFLLRSTSSLSAALPGRGPRWAVLAPELYLINNSRVPYSMNDGAVWAGRGLSGRGRGGIRFDWGRLSVIAAPEVVFSNNEPFEMPPRQAVLPRPPGRSPFSYPWHTFPNSIDLPIRFGRRAFSRLEPGQSGIAVQMGTMTVGVTTEDQWWGPGIRNAIVVSNNAPGIPRFYIRTGQPLETRIGRFEARWFVGALSESGYFDTVSTNNRRSVSAIGLTWQLKWMPTLTAGFARAVYAPLGRWRQLPGRLFNVFASVGRPNAASPTDSVLRPGRDQIYSLFARWIFPADHLETYFEWARTEAPASLRDLLAAPNHTRGYTFGLQWAPPIRADRATLLFAAEITDLERGSTFLDRPVATYYTSRAVVQGYTQRGKVIGAAIGPGASSQWLAADYVAPSWRAGVFVGRVRWDNDALYELPLLNFAGNENRWCAHDVSLLTGARGAYASPWGRFEGALTLAQRLNVFFHNFSVCGVDADRFDIHDELNTTIELRFTP
jgi:hypothetical protein